MLLPLFVIFYEMLRALLPLLPRHADAVYIYSERVTLV